MVETEAILDKPLLEMTATSPDNWIAEDVDLLQSVPEEDSIQLMPAFVPATKRYVCWIDDCNHPCREESVLRYHLQASHSDKSAYRCPHCSKKFSSEKDVSNVDIIIKHLRLHALQLYKCSECTFSHNLKQQVEKHVCDEHTGKLATVIIVRETSHEPEKPHQVVNKESKPWRCGMCYYQCTTEKEMISHVYNKHGMHAKYKCNLCRFKKNKIATFSDHFRTDHPGLNADVVHAYYQVEATSISSRESLEDLICDSTPELPGRDKNQSPNLLSNSEDEKRVIRSMAEIDKMDISELKNTKLYGTCGSYGKPFKKQFVCPLCLGFKTKQTQDIANHLYQEHRYHRYMCARCGLTRITYKSLQKHSTIKHPNLPEDIQSLPRDRNIEDWVQTLLLVQRRLISDNESLICGTTPGDQIKNKSCSVQTVTNLNSSASNSVDDIGSTSSIFDVESSTSKGQLDQRQHCSTKYKAASNMRDTEGLNADVVHAYYQVEATSISSIKFLEDLICDSTPQLPDWDKNQSPKESIAKLFNLLGNSEDEKRVIRSMAEIDKMDISELKNTKLYGTCGPYGKPFKKQFVCPLCSGFKTNQTQDIANHLYQELGYHRYLCARCGLTRITYKFLQKHSTIKHPNLPEDIQSLHRDRKIEDWVQTLLLVQRRLISDNESSISGSVQSVINLNSSASNSDDDIGSTSSIFDVESSMSKGQLDQRQHCSSKYKAASNMRDTEGLNADVVHAYYQVEATSISSIKSLEDLICDSTPQLPEWDKNQSPKESIAKLFNLLGNSEDKKRVIRSMAEIDKMDISELKNTKLYGTCGPYGKPFKKQFVCPLCSGFKTNQTQDIANHLYQELGYHRYMCARCGLTRITYKFLQKHSTIKHPNLPEDIQSLHRDRKIEDWVQTLLLVQRRLISDNESSISGSVQSVINLNSSASNSDDDIGSTSSIFDVESSMSKGQLDQRQHCSSKYKAASNMRDTEGFTNSEVIEHLKRAHPKMKASVVAVPTPSTSTIGMRKRKYPTSTWGMSSSSNEVQAKQPALEINKDRVKAGGNANNAYMLMCNYCPKQCFHRRELRVHWEAMHKVEHPSFKYKIVRRI